MNLLVLDEVTDIRAKSFFDSIFYLFLWSRTIADGAAAGLIAFITEASAFSFLNREHHDIMQTGCEMNMGKKKKSLGL